MSVLLSYGGVLGITIFHPLIKTKLEKVKNKYVKETISTSLAVQIIIAPIMMYTAKTFSITFIISNILTSYLITIIIILGFIIIISSLIFKPLANLIAIIYSPMLILLEKVTSLTAKIPYSKTYIKAPYLYQIIIYYLAILGLLYIIKTKKYNLLKKYKIQIIALILIIVLIPNLIEWIPKERLKLHMIDVGQGDACLIITPKNKKILIDGGGSESYNVRQKHTAPILTKPKDNHHRLCYNKPFRH